MSEVWKTTIPDLILWQVVKPGEVAEVSVSVHRDALTGKRSISVQINERDMAFDLDDGKPLGSGIAVYWGPSKDWAREFDRVNQGATGIEPIRSGTRLSGGLR